MIIAISSDAETLFLRNILDVMCLPAGYVHTFRYQKKYVGKGMVDAINKGEGGSFIDAHDRHILIFYAQRPTSEGEPRYVSDFFYVPIRFGRVVALRALGELVFVDIELGDFFASGRLDLTHLGVHWQRLIRGRVGALDARSKEGAFLDALAPPPWVGRNAVSTYEERWISVVEEIARLPSTRDCLFFLVRGVFVRPSYASDLCRRGLQWIVGRNPFVDDDVLAVEGRSLPIRRVRGVSLYSVPMGESVQIRLLFYRPSDILRPSISCRVSVSVDHSGYSDTLTKAALLESRYDELRFPFLAKRVFENVLSPISICVQETSGTSVMASQPEIMTAVVPPRKTLVLLLVLAALTPAFLYLGERDLQCLGAWVTSIASAIGLANPVCSSVNAVVALAKGVGALLVAATGWIAFRRFPIR